MQSLIGDRVAAVLGDLISHFENILSSCILDNWEKYWEILYNDNFDEEEVDAIELSTLQNLYNLEVDNDTVWQQKQKVSNISMYLYIYLSISIFSSFFIAPFFLSFWQLIIIFSLLSVMTS